MPRLDVCHPAPPRLTNLAQYGLLAVQHPGGYCWGSLSIWQIPLPKLNCCAWYSMPLCFIRSSPASWSPSKPTQRCTLRPSRWVTTT